MSKSRADQLLVDRGLAESRSRAQALILAGLVYAGGRKLEKAGQPLAEDTALEVRGKDHPWVSRGGIKLAHGLDQFGWEVTGAVALDVGSSTGGFTDVLLQRGAARVYAVDVGRGLIHERLRNDPRVTLMERVNARDLPPFPEPVTLVTADLSFIGLEKVLPAVRRAAPALHDLVALFKPQFEVGPAEVGRGGVVRDRAAAERALQRLAAWAEDHGWELRGRFDSPITGPAGNQEVLLHLVPAP